MSDSITYCPCEYDPKIYIAGQIDRGNVWGITYQRSLDSKTNMKKTKYYRRSIYPSSWKDITGVGMG